MCNYLCSHTDTHIPSLSLTHIYTTHALTIMSNPNVESCNLRNFHPSPHPTSKNGKTLASHLYVCIYPPAILTLLSVISGYVHELLHGLLIDNIHTFPFSLPLLSVNSVELFSNCSRLSITHTHTRMHAH